MERSGGRRAAMVTGVLILGMGFAMAAPASGSGERTQPRLFRDDFGQADDISGRSFPYSTWNIDTTGATTEPGEPIPSCVPGHGHSVWFAYSPVFETTLTIDTFGSNYDTVLAVYQDDWTTPVPNVCNDDAGGPQSEVVFTGSAGHIYYIQVSSYGTSNAGTLTFNASRTVWWDDIGAAVRIIGPLPYTSGGNTTVATLQSGEPWPCTVAHNNSVWWAYTPNAGVTLTADTAGSNYDTVLAVYSNGWANRVACNDEVGPIDPTSKVTFNATAGTTYYFQVSSAGGWSDGGTGLSFHLAESAASLPFDDGNSALEIKDPLPYHGGPWDTTSATVEPGEINGCGIPHSNSVWFVYTPNATRTLTVDTHGSNYDTVLSVGPWLSGFADCNDDAGPTVDTSEVTFPANSGVPYVFQVSSAGAASSGGTRLLLNVTGQASTYECNGEAATIVGTAGKDVILGTSGADVVVSLGGNDVIRTFGGADTVCAGPGRDKVFTGSGPDVAFGEDGNDLILTGGGGDIGSGGAGNDVIRCKGGRDECSGDRGDDEVYAGNGDDWVWGGPGDDVLYGGAGYDWMRGGSGADQCYSGEDVIC